MLDEKLLEIRCVLCVSIRRPAEDIFSVVKGAGCPVHLNEKETWETRSNFLVWLAYWLVVVIGFTSVKRETKKVA